MSDEQYCDQCGLNHKEIRQSFRSSLYLTAVSLCGFNSKNYGSSPNTFFHLQALNWIQQKIESGKTRILVMWPRGHLKTSLVTVALSIWQIIRDRNTRGFIVHKLPTESQNFLSMVRAILLSEEFRHFFPDISPFERIKNQVDEFGNPIRWKKDEIDCIRDRYHPQATVTAKGLRSSLEGTHPLWVIADDIVDRHVTESPSLMQKAISFREQIGQILEDPKTGLFVVVGTLWPGGFYEPILAGDEYEKFVVGCYVDSRLRSLINVPDSVKDGSPIFPERYTKEELERLEKEMGSYTFAHQFLNHLTSRASAVFKAEQFRKYFLNELDGTIQYVDARYRGKIDRVLRVQDATHLTLTVDPSMGTGKDESAITVLAAFMREGLIFEIDRWHGYESPVRLVERICEMAEKWGVKEVGVEAAGFQTLLKQWLFRRMTERTQNFRIVELRPKLRKKSSRIISALQPWVESGRFFVREGHEDIIMEAVRYNPDNIQAKDNILDSLAYHLDMWEVRLRPRKQKTDEELADDIEFDDAYHRGKSVTAIFGVPSRKLYDTIPGGVYERNVQILSRRSKMGVGERYWDALRRMSRRR